MNKDIARCVIALGVVVSLAACTPKHDGDNKLVILHTNDTLRLYQTAMTLAECCVARL